VVELMREGWMERFGGGIEFEPDTGRLIAKALAHIDAKRAELGLSEYDPERFGESGDRQMEELLCATADDAPLALYSARKPLTVETAKLETVAVAAPKPKRKTPGAPERRPRKQTTPAEV